MTALRPFILALSLLSVTERALADVGEHEGNYQPEKATHRSDVVAILQVGGAAGDVAGYPNVASQIDRPEFRADTGFGAGLGWTALIGVAPRDWFTFAVGLSSAAISAGGKESSGTNFVLHAETFPLFYEGGAFRDLGVFAEFGAGGRNIVEDGETVAEGGFTSVVTGGAVFEPLKLGYIRIGPMLSYTHEFSTTLSAHLVLGALRVVYYGGPNG